MRWDANAFGSWAIATIYKQLLLDGKDDVIVAKEWSEENQEWTLRSVTEVQKVNFSEFKRLESFMRP